MAVLAMLEDVLGKAAFRDVLRTIVRNHAGRAVGRRVLAAFARAGQTAGSNATTGWRVAQASAGSTTGSRVAQAGESGDEVVTAIAMASGMRTWRIAGSDLAA